MEENPMAVTDDAQLLATYNANASAGAPASLLQPGNLAVTESIVSGTPFQISKQRAATLYIAIATAAAITVSMGPEAAGTSVPLVATATEAIGLSTLDVPAGWYVKITGTVADFVATAVLK
jgi:hypothetical protein